MSPDVILNQQNDNNIKKVILKALVGVKISCGLSVGVIKLDFKQEI